MKDREKYMPKEKDYEEIEKDETLTIKEKNKRIREMESMCRAEYYNDLAKQEWEDS